MEFLIFILIYIYLYRYIDVYTIYSSVVVLIACLISTEVETKGTFIKMTASRVNPQDAGRAGFSQTHCCPWQPCARGLSLTRQLLAWDTITPFLHTQRMVTGLLGWEKPEFSWNLVHGQAACCLLKPDICDWFCLTGDRERKSRIRNNSYYKQNKSKKKN